MLPDGVVIGPLAHSLERLIPLAAGRAVPLISDARVFALHGTALRDSLDIRPILIPEGEAGKSWRVLGEVLEQLAAIDPDRSAPIVTLGGGSVGDLGGLAASLFKRGCPVVHVPTTLMAQADSALGGKTAIDFAGQKNLVGAFHAPALVIADPALLATLEPRQLRSGYAEIVKYGLIDDPAWFAWCEANGGAVLGQHGDAIGEAIAYSAAAKARIIGGDRVDRSGQRALLNLGHSFAHAIEAEAGLGRLLHGEAVAVGLVLAFRLSARLGLAAAIDAGRVATHLAAAGLPTSLGAVGVRGAALVPHLARDKKNLGGVTTLVLVRGIGQAFVARDVSAEALAAFLAEA
jgi:3-dehydroquinate synthase